MYLGWHIHVCMYTSNHMHRHLCVEEQRKMQSTHIPTTSTSLTCGTCTLASVAKYTTYMYILHKSRSLSKLFLCHITALLFQHVYIESVVPALCFDFHSSLTIRFVMSGVSKPFCVVRYCVFNEEPYISGPGLSS